MSLTTAQGGTEQSHSAAVTPLAARPPVKEKPLTLPGRAVPRSSMRDGIPSERTERDETEVE